MRDKKNSPISRPAPAEKQPGTESDSQPDSDIVEPENALDKVTMEDLPRQVREAAARAGWTKLMPVQAKTIPYILKGRDLMIQSRTGSGKTGAYILPILERINPNQTSCQVLILVPTRELARQVDQEAKTLSGGTKIQTIAVYGGVGYGPQIKAFSRGAQLIIGTPGRILDHLLKRSLSLSHLKVLIFDEADRMLSMGFYPDMKELQNYLPSRRMNGYMFSATFPSHVIRLAGEFLNKPEFLSLSRDHVHVAETQHIYYVVPAMKKDRSLIRIIEIENPASAIIFCNTRAEVTYVTTVLQRFGYDADALSSDLPQGARDKIMERVRKGTLRFLVATDVAARGIDLPELSHVFIFEPPEDPEIYIHRAGRTGRAGAGGISISLVSDFEEMALKRIAKRYGIDMLVRPLPTEVDVEAIVSQRVTALLEARLRARDKLQTERMQRFIPLSRSLAENEDESSLMAMLLDDYYQQTLHAPLIPPPQQEKASGSEGAEPGEKKNSRPRRGRRRERRPKKTSS